LAHNAEPTDEDTVPASHFEHAKDPAGAYLPGPQSVQAKATLAPTAAENLQATQSVQTVASEYFPASQLSHAVLMPAVALYFPTSHLVQREVPSNEYVPATQSVQTVAALSSEYFPTSQLSHAVLTLAVALYFPASHLVQSAAPANEYVPAPQSRAAK
jgi:hypothetical protein